MKTLITLVIAFALLVGPSAFAQPSTGHQYSRTGNYKEPVKHEATEARGQRHEDADRPVGHEYSRTGDYREPKAGQRNAQHDERSVFEGLGERTKVVAPASAPNRHGTTNR